MHPEKASGPGGFNPIFFQKFWDVSGDDIFAAGVGWLEQGMFHVGFNDTIITLIPKCFDLATMRDLRPIALCNGVYKVVAKVLAIRLAEVRPNSLLLRGTLLLIMFLLCLRCYIV